MAVKKSGSAGVISGILAGAVFILFYLVLSIGFGLSIAAAVVSYIGFYLVMAPSGSVEIDYRVAGMTAEEFNRTMQEGKSKVDEIRRYCINIDRAEIRKKIEHLCLVADNIFEDIKKDPKDIKTARRFLSYYLDTTIKIIKKYVELSSSRSLSSDAQNSLDKVEGMLDSIGKTFEKQMQKLIEDDILDLDTEISVLEQTIKSEGL